MISLESNHNYFWRLRVKIFKTVESMVLNNWIVCSKLWSSLTSSTHLRSVAQWFFFAFNSCKSSSPSFLSFFYYYTMSRKSQSMATKASPKPSRSNPKPWFKLLKSHMPLALCSFLLNEFHISSTYRVLPWLLSNDLTLLLSRPQSSS